MQSSGQGALGLAELARAMQRIADAYGDGADSAAGGASAEAACSRRLSAAALAFAQLERQNARDSDDAVRGFVLDALLPLAADCAAPAARQVVAASAAVLARRRMWGFASALVAAAAAALTAPPGSGQRRSSDGGGGGGVGARRGGAENDGDGGVAAAVGALPANACGALAFELVSAAAAAFAAAGDGSVSGPERLLALAAAEPLLPAALACLASADGGRRRAALQQLLPAALAAARALGPAAFQEALQEVWARCNEMLPLLGTPRRMALAALLQHAVCWRLQPPDGAGLDGVPDDSDNSGDGSSGDSAARLELGRDESEAFWARLRTCLADAEPLNRKRALRLLQELLPPGAASRQPAWAVWLGALDALEDFTPHLQTATWHLVRGWIVVAMVMVVLAVGDGGGGRGRQNNTSQPSRYLDTNTLPRHFLNKQQTTQSKVSRLHPVDPAYADADAEADAAARRNRLDRLKVGARGAACAAGAKEQRQRQQPQQRQQQAERGSGGNGGGGGNDDPGPQQQGPPLHFRWTAVLWRLALGHDHPLVQRSALRTLLKRDWAPPFARQVPAAFLSGVLLPALNAPAHHTGRPGDAFDAATAAAAMARRWAAAAGPAEARALLAAGLAALAAPGMKDMTKGGVLAQVACLEAAAEGAGPALVDGGAADGSGGGDGSAGAAWAAEQLRRLRAFVGASGWPHGAATHATCCAAAARIAALIAPGGGADAECFDASCQLLVALPRWCVAAGVGELHFSVQRWLLAADKDGQEEERQQQGSGAPSPPSVIAARAERLWRSFLDVPSGAPRRPSSERDYAQWAAVCDAWARMSLVCGARCAPQARAAARELARLVGDAYQRPYMQPALRDRALCLLSRALDAALTAADADAAAGGGDAAAGRGTALLLAELSAALVEAPAFAESLGAYAELCCAWYWRGAAAAAEAGGGGGGGSGGGDSAGGLGPEEWALAARAEVATQALALAAEAVARRGDAASSGAAQGALGRLMGSLQALAVRFARSPLPTAAAHGGSGGDAAAAAERRASALRALRSIATGVGRAALAAPAACAALRTAPAASDAAALAGAVVREAAAADAEDERAAHATASGGASVHVDWDCLDAVLALLLLAAPQEGSGGISRTGGGSSAAVAATLSPEHLAALSAAALEALRWTLDDAGPALGTVARCAARLFRLALAAPADVQAQVAAAAAAAAGGGAHEEEPPAAAVARAFCGALLDSLATITKRTAALCGALLGAALQPAAFGDPALLLLHAPVGAAAANDDSQQQPPLQPPPLKAFVAGALRLSARSLGLRVALALRLARLVAVAPAMLQWYAPELTELLLGWPGGAAPMVSFETAPEDLGGAPLPESEELGLLRGRLDAPAAAAVAAGDAAPRLAVASALHGLAARLGLAAADDGDNGEGGTTATAAKATNAAAAVDPQQGSPEWRAAAEAAGLGFWRQLLRLALTDPRLSCECLKPGGDAHRLQARAWQALVVASHFCRSEADVRAAVEGARERAGGGGVIPLLHSLGALASASHCCRYNARRPLHNPRNQQNAPLPATNTHNAYKHKHAHTNAQASCRRCPRTRPRASSTSRRPS